MIGGTQAIVDRVTGVSAKVHARAAVITSAAMHFLLRGRAATALAMFDQALAFNDTDLRALAGKAMALCQLGDSQAGVEVAGRALALNPLSGILYDARGFCYAHIGDHARATADFDKALAVSPDDHNVYYNYACYCCGRGQDEKARVFLRAAFEKGPAVLPSLAERDPDLVRYREEQWFRDMMPSEPAIE
jgi:Flp pilus assembly protein TadD